MQYLDPRPTHINERLKLGSSLKLLNGRNWVVATEAGVDQLKSFIEGAENVGSS
jgi:hypothetical protein